ncbi:MAG: HlyC/CorC family transporter [Geodermatophilaceae bacterium]|nr:HlyC/CorC family transporter [Geodermatophilaceae bacterium]
MSDYLALVLAVLLLAGNAFFVGAEFAIISARRSGIEPLADKGSVRARITLGAMEDVSRMLATAQLGITVCSLGLGAVGEPAVAHLLERPLGAVGITGALLHGISFSVALAIVVYLHVVLGEMVPKNIALAGPERSALMLAPALVMVARILRPVIASLNGLANGMLRLMRVEPRDEVASAFTGDEIAGMVDEARREGLLNPESERLLSGALAFEEHTAADVLLPLAELVTVDARATPTEVEQVCARTGYSRFVTVENGGLTGYLHVKDVLDLSGAAAEYPVPAARIRALASVAVDERIAEVLERMQGGGAHVAAVHDANGETVGVVMLEDVIETLVGDVRDAMQVGGPTA